MSSSISSSSFSSSSIEEYYSDKAFWISLAAKVAIVVGAIIAGFGALTMIESFPLEWVGGPLVAGTITLIGALIAIPGVLIFMKEDEFFEWMEIPKLAH